MVREGWNSLNTDIAFINGSVKSELEAMQFYQYPANVAYKEYCKLVTERNHLIPVLNGEREKSHGSQAILDELILRAINILHREYGNYKHWKKFENFILRHHETLDTFYNSKYDELMKEINLENELNIQNVKRISSINHGINNDKDYNTENQKDVIDLTLSDDDEMEVENNGEEGQNLGNDARNIENDNDHDSTKKVNEKDDKTEKEYHYFKQPRFYYNNKWSLTPPNVR